MSLDYQSLVGYEDGARKLHVHLTEIPDTASHPPYQYDHKAEEAFYILEGKTVKAGPGETVFILSGVCHAEINFLTSSMRYLTIRTIEEGDERCCCGKDRE